MSNWVYIRSEENLWTVGFYEPYNGVWHPDSDWKKKEDARKRCHYLNGGGANASEYERRIENLTEEIRRIREEWGDDIYKSPYAEGLLNGARQALLYIRDGYDDHFTISYTVKAAVGDALGMGDYYQLTDGENVLEIRYFLNYEIDAAQREAEEKSGGDIWWEKIDPGIADSYYAEAVKDW